MTRRLLPALIASVAVALLLLGPFSGRRGGAQTAPVPVTITNPTGRFQVVGVGDQDAKIVLIDTATGRCWSRLPIKASYWEDLGTPIVEPKK